ncbi:MAG: M20/M25/M40 family metallo-hydrolase [Eubacteriales bacterium]|nr:M20/M25/M40 family metallo-hydrolase [Christensenellaceae bacterium]MDY3242095.1 M20/M25/M40 family metallo-hydrolase [Eubacteriales bacterium]
MLITTMIIRTLLCKPKEINPGEFKAREFDKDVVAKHLSEAVRIPTVSMVGEYEGQDAPFFAYHEWLEKTYPLIHKTAEKTVINRYSLVYRFKGTNSDLRPGAFLAHQDVVPAPKEGWEVEPFGGEIKDGFIWGRGTQDMKGTMIALLEGMEKLLSEGWQPERDVYFCFGHDEEPWTEEGAPYIAKWFKEQNIKLEYIIDEGGTIVDGKMIGVNKLFGLIGTCEKGNMNMTLTVEKPGGHASNPAKPSAAAILAKALIKIDKHPMPSKWTPATKQTFRMLAPHMPFPIRFVLVNRDIFGPLLKFVFKKIPLTNALISTTFAETMLKGSDAENVIPPKVTANINTRIITGVTRDEVLAYTQKLVGKKVKVEKLAAGTEATAVSPVDVRPWDDLNIAIKQIFPDMVTAPYMFIANSDSRYYGEVSDNIYRFTPFEMTLDDQKRIHALNERVSLDSMVKASQFFAQCLEIMNKG